ncbi:MAG: CDP-alcohol phosphatidyltransferase family protein [Opitutales bacterium]|nr:CDP-alcohol phosphatidyltransferase family protein [Opitutales bacterium]
MKHLPNILTLSRIPLLFVIVTLLCFPVKFGDTLAFVLFMIAAVSDWLDGYIARKVGAVSNFGKLMDALTDKIIMVGLFVALLALRWKLPDAYGNAASELETLLPQHCILLVMVIICREFLITGLRLVAASNGIVLAAEKAGKIKTALQMVSMSLLLAAQALATDWNNFLPTELIAWARELGLWTFYAAVLLTIYSGTGYLIRNRKIFLGDAV